MQRSGIALDIKNLHKSFGNKVVHRGVSFQLYWNEILGLLGGSGSGKSLILRSIIGLEKPDQGEIIFDGKDLSQMGERELFPIRARISYVFQNGALFDSLSVEDNLAYPLREHTRLSEKEILEKVNEVLATVDMTGSNELFPAELSGGMQKRAGLARATISSPEIILFDEPTAGLDPINTHRLVRNIKSVKSRGTTGIFVTHDLPAAFEICHRIAILRQGQIYTVDTVDNIRNSKDPFVHAFIRGDEDGSGQEPQP
ncbi:MAG: ATP-binding cassette domain-containing protein [Oligoflexia bacterium]|nr:ATP-binding cassette domain-containing protein [Oligoflexia bacterium]